MPEAACSSFEPQSYLRDRCKKCFMLRSKHDIVTLNADNKNNTAASFLATKERNREKRRSWRDKSQMTAENGAPEHDCNEDDTISSVSFKSANSKGLSSAKSLESISSNPDSKSMITAISESLDEDERAATPTDFESLEMANLREEVARLTEELNQTRQERQNWTLRSRKNLDDDEKSLLETLEERLAEAESVIQDYKDENAALKCELREVQENAETNRMNEKLKAAESLCEELMDENEALKSDVRDLQQEIEEMQDQYREEEIEEFRELQRELEQNAKNCRILQFKLRKSERLREETQTEKEHLEAKVQVG
ncbi:hypothetical protein AB6A40_007334 [Gnathostoma spinigerum]|uniref:Uncharacterized protein n=1 Tax=Gnathostoma spinigerum TaxID=75299 RepID=A0ABD6EWI9_9BILA